VYVAVVINNYLLIAEGGELSNKAKHRKI